MINEGVALHIDMTHRLLLVSEVRILRTTARQDMEHGRIIVIHNKVKPGMLIQSRATHHRV